MAEKARSEYPLTKMERHIIKTVYREVIGVELQTVSVSMGFYLKNINAIKAYINNYKPIASAELTSVPKTKSSPYPNLTYPKFKKFVSEYYDALDNIKTNLDKYVMCDDNYKRVFFRIIKNMATFNHNCRNRIYDSLTIRTANVVGIKKYITVMIADNILECIVSNVTEDDVFLIANNYKNRRANNTRDELDRVFKAGVAKYDKIGCITICNQDVEDATALLIAATKVNTPPGARLKVLRGNKR